MYSTCLFCHDKLGTNDAIEHFPVGRRLAFDAAKGRLWVVCRKCERWNLTPIEERWEAIEECERAFRDTKLRVSTDHIGLARLKEGLELVRIGEPQRPEMAAWRYGDQFGRRRTRARVRVLGGMAVATAYIAAGPILGLVGTGAFFAANAAILGRHLYRVSAIAARVRTTDGRQLVVRPADVAGTFLRWQPRDRTWSLSLLHEKPWHRSDRWGDEHRETTFTELRGTDAIDAARQLLPRINATGAKRDEVTMAVQQLEKSADPDVLFARAARSLSDLYQSEATLGQLHGPTRLALEMVVNEDSERRALEGELHLLEAAWKAAEEIAGIADDMFLPASVDEDLARLKRQRDAE